MMTTREDAMRLLRVLDVRVYPYSRLLGEQRQPAPSSPGHLI
jgi:hypothetical protein